MVQEVSATPATEGEPILGSAGSHAAPGTVPLDRFLTVATLNPAEASYVAARLLRSSEGPDDDRWAVALTAAGGVEVTRTPPGAGARPGELLAGLVHSARRLPSHAAPGQRVLLRRLEEAAAEPGPDPRARGARLDAALVEVLGADAGERLGAQLAGLVEAYAHLAAGTTAPPAPRPREPRPPAPRRAEPAPRFAPRRRTRAGGRRRLPTGRAALVVLLLVVAAASSGYVLTRRVDEASAGSDRDPTTGAPTGKASATPSPKAAPRKSASPRPRVETLAPRSAGAVTGVELRRAADCSAGALCAVTVTARFQPAPTAQTVTWRVGTAASCDGTVSWSAPVSVTAQPGWTRVYASSSVAMPQRRPVALVATTTAPARVQSSPVPVTGSSLRC